MSTTATTFWGTGRRKTSTARVRVREGTGLIEINGKNADQFFTHENFSRVALRPLATAEMKEKIDVFANVSGGGNTGQAEAVAHGISRALLKLNPELRPVLKKAGHLTRDPRAKERKKPGQPGARKRFQFSKR
jgi:small subunit ribosomal protein S9